VAPPNRFKVKVPNSTAKRRTLAKTRIWAYFVTEGYGVCTAHMAPLNYTYYHHYMPLAKRKK